MPMTVKLSCYSIFTIYTAFKQVKLNTEIYNIIYVVIAKFSRKIKLQ